MTPQDFCYWLQGYFELSGTDTLTETHTKIIKDHLKLVMHKMTPKYDFDKLKNLGELRTDFPTDNPNIVKDLAPITRASNIEMPLLGDTLAFNKDHIPETITMSDGNSFGVNNCPLMHPTCSQMHHSSDPHNTTEEREKLLAHEKNIFGNAIPMGAQSENYYRNIRCTMTC